MKAIIEDTKGANIKMEIQLVRNASAMAKQVNDIMQQKEEMQGYFNEEFEEDVTLTLDDFKIIGFMPDAADEDDKLTALLYRHLPVLEHIIEKEKLPLNQQWNIHTREHHLEHYSWYGVLAWSAFGFMETYKSASAAQKEEINNLVFVKGESFGAAVNAIVFPSPRRCDIF